MRKLASENIDIVLPGRSFPVLQNLTLSLFAGEFVGVVGPNGSGKSTLIRTLSRTLKPISGQIFLEDLDLYGQVSARQSAQGVAVVPQNTDVSFDFSVREVVEMGRAPHLARRPFVTLTPGDEKAVAQAMDDASVESLSERRVTHLSGGEAQRAVFARALAQTTDVLLLDEPTAHLDLRHQDDLLSLARSLAHDQGKAVMAVLHDLNLASSYCDRLLLMQDGQIVAEGTPEQVLTSDRILHVYDMQVWVRKSLLTGRPYVTPLPWKKDSPVSDHVVLVLCGSGTGGPLVSALIEEGLKVLIGGLHKNDPDAEAATALGVAYPQEAPFSPFSRDVILKMRNDLAVADYVVLTEVPFGPMNLPLLDIALSALEAGKPLFCIQSPETPFSLRDHTGGLASLRWEQLIARGAITVADPRAAASAIRQLGVK